MKQIDFGDASPRELELLAAAWRSRTVHVEAVTPPDLVPLVLDIDDWRFLRHCLHNMEQHWRQAIAQADAEAGRPQAATIAQPGSINVEPTSAGYRTAGRLFRDELERVEQLNTRLGDILQAVCEDGDRP